METDNPGERATSSGGPLSGLRVVDLSTFVAGPSATMTLAQLGAEVIRVDPIGGAADIGRLPRDPAGNSLYWAGLNKGKRSIEVDTSSDEGRALVGRLIAGGGAGGGIVVTNAVGQEWLSYDSLARLREDVIVVHIVGTADGAPAVDYTVNCEVGLPDITGPAELDTPVNHVLPAWDLLAGLNAALAVVTADRQRQATGQGAAIQISLADVAVANMAHLGFVSDVVVNDRDREREGNYLYGNFGCDVQTADRRRIMIVALTRRHWRKLVELTGIGAAITALEQALDVDLAQEEDRYTHREVVAALVRPWFRARTFAEATEALAASGVLWGAYRSVRQLVTEPDSLLHQGTLMADIDHPVGGRYPTPRTVLDDEEWRATSARSADRLGAATAAVLTDLLELDAGEVADLEARGVVGGRP